VRPTVCIVLATVIASGGIAMANDSPAGTSFDELLDKVKKDSETPSGPTYHSVVSKVYHEKLLRRIMYCVVGEIPPSESFQVVLIIGADGKVSQDVVSSETRMSKCIQKQFLKGKFPQPPFAPFHDVIEMDFQVEK